MNALSQDSQSRYRLEIRIGNLRGNTRLASLSKNTFNCDEPPGGLLDGSVDWASHLAEAKRLDLAIESAENEIATMKAKIGSSIIKVVGRVTGRTQGGYFILGIAIPYGDEPDFVYNPKMVLNGPFYVSGNGLNIVSGAALLPSAVVFKGTTNATNAFGVRMVINSYSSSLPPRQRKVVAELDRLDKELDKMMERKRSDSGPDEETARLMLDIQRWRSQWCQP